MAAWSFSVKAVIVSFFIVKLAVGKVELFKYINGDVLLGPDFLGLCNFLGSKIGLGKHLKGITLNRYPRFL